MLWIRLKAWYYQHHQVKEKSIIRGLIRHGTVLEHLQEVCDRRDMKHPQLHLSSVCLPFFTRESSLSSSFIKAFLKLESQVEEAHLSSNLTCLRHSESTQVLSTLLL